MTGRYRLVESIGQGGMGRVWRAADETLDRQVAVKEMRIDRMDQLDQEDARVRRERTLREARATARIDHPNVVRVYDVVDEGERLWIVMELVDGRSLEQVVAEDGPLSPRDTARIGLELVAALGQVHAGGVLHRDIKPGNVLVERRAGRVVLTDFGIAAIQNTEALTVAGMLVGSPDYMAPERVSGRPQGPPSDLWSLGATLCAALGGRSPFSRGTTLATLHAVLYEEPEIPPTAGELREPLTDLLRKDPAVRPALEQLAALLSPVADDSTVTVTPPPPDVTPPDEPEPAPETAPGDEEETTALGTPKPAQPVQPVQDAIPVRRTPTLRTTPDPSTPATPASPATPSTPDTTDNSSPSGAKPTPAEPEAPAPEPRPAPPDVGNTSSEAPPGSTPELPSEGATPGRPGSRRKVLTAAVGVAVAGALAGLLVPLLGGSPGDKDKASRSGSGADTPPPTVEGTARPPSLPAGSRTEAGLYAWVPPKGWERVVQSGAEVHYTSPDRKQEVLANASPARGDLMDQWQKTEKSTSKGLDYRRIRLEETTFKGRPAVVWEYTVTAKGLPWHARLLGFDTGGKSYEITTWYYPEIEDRALPVYEKVQKSFTPL
ncbi:protein kinase domain-containing protein [Streptomyces sp. CWNU-52B]|uniref:serine/threonine-protein kinase n=1 Tax=unclassified Streptomyces TaxID=2593676 RepID=UPI0039BF22F0